VEDNKVYNKILVPLDTSELSECSLEHVVNITRSCNISQVILFTVIEPLSAQAVSTLAQAGGEILLKAEQDNQNAARNYINRVSERLTNRGISNEVVVKDGRPAEEILEFCRQNGIDMIIMSTHGRSGATRWFFGSVAEKVARHSAIPVLLISPPGCRVADG
jgi:nucleotide-binding universal stress UspA family protein